MRKIRELLRGIYSVGEILSVFPKQLMIFAFCLTLLMMLHGSAVALEEYDYRKDTEAYCRAVADLNTDEYRQTSAKSQNPRRNAVVLFMTDGTQPAFGSAPFTAVQVIYGPKGFGTLLCDDPDTAVEWLLSQTGVKCAEKDGRVEGSDEAGPSGENAENVNTIPFHSWGAKALGMSEYCSHIITYGSGSATVAVVDSGVCRHSMLSSRMTGLGYDYIDNDADPTNDLNGHGTFVAGIVADCTPSMKVNIYPIRVLDAYASGKISNVVCAVLEAANAGVDVINLSLSTFAESDVLESAIRSAVNSGTAVVVAAGNYSENTASITPARMTDAGVIVVGSAEADGTRSSYSDFGASVDVYVYGSGIESCSRTGGFTTDSGTSMAAPHISALCAMMRLLHPGVSPSGMEKRMKATAAETLPVPDVRAMIPNERGFELERITLRTGDTLILPGEAYPLTACEKMRYSSENSNVLTAEGNILTAAAPGASFVTASCTGLEDAVFTVNVTDEDRGDVILPSGLQMIMDEAFYGLCTGKVIVPYGTEYLGEHAFDGGAIDFIVIPDSVDHIDENDFSGAVVMCGAESTVMEYVKQNSLHYVISEQ